MTEVHWILSRLEWISTSLSISDNSSSTLSAIEPRGIKSRENEFYILFCLLRDKWVSARDAQQQHSTGVHIRFLSLQAGEVNDSYVGI